MTKNSSLNFTMNKEFNLIKKHDSMHIIMNHNSSNAIDINFLIKFQEIMDKIPNEIPLSITGNDRFFSSGLDLSFTQKLNRTKMHQIIHQFEKLLQSILERSGCTVAIVKGHAVAGGFILASACDHIYCLPGDYKIGMNENKLDIHLPPIPKAILINTYKNQINQILNTDDFLSIDQTKLLSNITKISHPSKVKFIHMKNKEKVEGIMNYLKKNKTNDMNLFLNSWFSKTAIKNRETILEKLKTKIQGDRNN